MAKCIIWRQADGSIAVSIPSENDRRKGETVQDQLDRFAARLVSDGVALGWTRLADADADSLPQSRRFRNAWRHDGEKPVVNLPLARAQVLSEIRAERNAKLDASDKELARLTDVGSAKELEDIKAKRQALRDLPAVVAAELSALTTVAELEQYRPQWSEEK